MLLSVLSIGNVAEQEMEVVRRSLIGVFNWQIVDGNNHISLRGQKIIEEALALLDVCEIYRSISTDPYYNEGLCFETNKLMVITSSPISYKGTAKCGWAKQHGFLSLICIEKLKQNHTLTDGTLNIGDYHDELRNTALHEFGHQLMEGDPIECPDPSCIMAEDYNQAVATGEFCQKCLSKLHGHLRT